MDALKLKADVRPGGKGHAKNLRSAGLVPAIIYGKDRDPEMLQIEERSLDKVLSEAGTHQLIALEIGSKRPVMTLAREIQRGVIKREYLHVDFMVINMDEKTQAEVPVVLVGESRPLKSKVAF
jgi:large subunit ribosomal protein L25